MKNGKPTEWDARLDRLEADVKEIKAMLQAQQPKEPWWKGIVGTFADDPVFEEIDKLTSEIREKQRAKVRRRSKKKVNT